MIHTMHKAMTVLSYPGKISVVILLIYVLVAIWAPYLSPYPHNLSSASPLVPPGRSHLMGTDELGFDLWAQISYGARISLVIGVATATLSVLIGGVVGALSGYLGGWADRLIMRLVDILIAIPELPLIILMATFLGPSLTNIVAVLVAFSWTRPARIIRSQILVVKTMTYVVAAQTYGASPFYVMRVHFLREIFPILAMNMIRMIGRAIISEASLSFLGLGDPTSKSWGLILHHALNFRGIFHTAFWKWWIVFPCLSIFLLSLALAFISRDVELLCDPELQHVR